MKKRSANNNLTRSSPKERDFILDQIPGLFCVKNLDLAYVWCSDDFASFLNLVNKLELIGRNDQDLPWSELADTFEKDDRYVIQHKCPLSNIYKLTNIPNHKDLWTLIKKKPLFDAENEVIGVIIYLLDITDIKTKEEQYRRNYEFLEDIIYNMPGVIFWKNTKFQYMGFNQNLVKVSGLSRQEIWGKTDYELNWGTKEASSFQKDDQEIMSTGEIKVTEHELPIKRPDGYNMIVRTEKSRLCDKQGNVIGVLAIAIDITEIKNLEKKLTIALEKAEAANKAKTQFVTNMSHDIRTPITGVIGLAEILEKEGANEQDRNYGQVIHTSSEQLLNLLNDILDVISADSLNEDDVQIEEVDIRELIYYLKGLLLPNLYLKTVKLEEQVAASVPKYILMDRIKIERILLNVLGNSIKFTAKGSIKLSVNFNENHHKNAHLQFLISDTGIGIPENQLDKVFDRFFRATPSFEGVYEGHGIGLFIVRKYVSLLKGTIHLSSELGKGTTISIQIPINHDAKISVKSGSEQEKSMRTVTPKIKKEKPNYLESTVTVNPSDKMKILFVEDDIVARHMGQKIFHRIGHNVEAVSDAENALKRAKATRFDLIITDIGLPGMSGNEFAVAYRFWEKLNTNTNLPIIGLSAHISKKTKEESFLAGMNDVISKPFSEEKAKQLIAMYIDGDGSKHSFESEKVVEAELPVENNDLFLLDSYPLIDEKIALECGISQEMLDELLKVLVQETLPEEMTSLVTAYKQKDWDTIRNVAHKLKGAALYSGTTKLKFACQYMEKYLLAGHKELTKELYKQLIAVLKETEIYLKQYLKLE